MLEIIALGLSGAATVGGYLKARHFVRGRLRFVDAAQRAVAPWLAGAATAVLAAPVVWLLPVVGTGTALAVGAGVGLGVAHGARDLRRLNGYQLDSGG